MFLRPASSGRLGEGLRLASATLLGTVGVPRYRSLVAEHRSTLNDTLPVHSKWWRRRAAAGGDLVYVAIGDSAAQGIGASRPDRSYVGLLAEHAAALTGREVHAVNLSVSGATTALAVRDQLPRLAALDLGGREPDLVTVSIGANDIADWNPAAFERNIRDILDAVPAHAIVADLPCFHLPHNERKVAHANRMLRAAARERGLTVVPLHALTRRQGLRGILTQFARDMFHPNDDGYRVWAEAFRPAVERVLLERGADEVALRASLAAAA
ncbi:SGNH/GDSL hydrolase family protein [Agromyces sp. G08B096]|uniref:SGNH/GDSL hydrolase family protein n=1 Tax=Agromyces sp. G08B096 TaxID=3156399 RepID=A0AAU7W9E4_9MICO